MGQRLNEIVHELIIVESGWVRILLELINEYSKVSGYKISTQKSLACYTLTMRKQKEKLRKQFHLPLQRKE